MTHQIRCKSPEVAKISHIIFEITCSRQTFADINLEILHCIVCTDKANAAIFCESHPSKRNHSHDACTFSPTDASRSDRSFHFALRFNVLQARRANGPNAEKLFMTVWASASVT